VKFSKFASAEVFKGERNCGADTKVWELVRGANSLKGYKAEKRREEIATLQLECCFVLWG
jgi:hypothetical protein